MGKLKAFEVQMELDGSVAPKQDVKVEASKEKELKYLAFKSSIVAGRRY